MPSAECHNLGPIHILVGDNSRIHSQLLAEALKRDPRFVIVGAVQFRGVSGNRVPHQAGRRHYQREPRRRAHGWNNPFARVSRPPFPDSSGHASGLAPARHCPRCFSLGGSWHLQQARVFVKSVQMCLSRCRGPGLGQQPRGHVCARCPFLGAQDPGDKRRRAEPAFTS